MSDVKRAVVKRSPDEWRAIVSRFERSGQGCREFCMAEDLAPRTCWWWRRKLGRTSEKRLEFDSVEQANLFAALGIETPPEQDIPTQEIRYRRREKRRDGAINESGLRFDETVPVEVIEVVDPAIEAIPQGGPRGAWEDA